MYPNVMAAWAALLPAFLLLLGARSAHAAAVYTINATFTDGSNTPAGLLTLSGTYTFPDDSGDQYGDPLTSYDLTAAVNSTSVELTGANSTGNFLHTFEDFLGGDGIGIYNQNLDQLSLYFGSGFTGVGPILPSVNGEAGESDSQVILGGTQIFNLVSGSSYLPIVVGPGDGGDKISVPPNDPAAVAPEPQTAALITLGLVAVLRCRRWGSMS